MSKQAYAAALAAGITVTSSGGRRAGLEPPRGARHRRGPVRRQHRRLRVHQPGEPGQPGDRRQLRAAAHPELRPQLLPLLRRRRLRHPDRQRRRRPRRPGLPLPVRDHGRETATRSSTTPGRSRRSTTPNLNVRQTYDVIRFDPRRRHRGRHRRQPAGGAVERRQSHLPGRPTPRWRRRRPRSEGGMKFFAGPRDEPFFVDLHVFDLLGVGGAPDHRRRQRDVDRPRGADRRRRGRRRAADRRHRRREARPRHLRHRLAPAGAHPPAATTTTRNRGQWIQVSRLGWPLINEVIIPLKDKDNFNRSRPKDDVANFGSYILVPELPGLLNAVLGAGCADDAGGRPHRHRRAALADRHDPGRPAAHQRHGGPDLRATPASRTAARSRTTSPTRCSPWSATTGDRSAMAWTATTSRSRHIPLPGISALGKSDRRIAP